MMAAMQERTHYRPTADSALMRWIVRHAAWLFPRFRGSDVQSPLYRAVGGPYRRKLVGFGETVLVRLPEVGKGSGNPAPKLANRRKSGGGWERATSRTSTLSEQTMELHTREVYNDSQRTAGQKRTSSKMKKRTTTMAKTKSHPTSQTTKIMTWRARRFCSPTQLRRRARAEKRSAQKHKTMCS